MQINIMLEWFLNPDHLPFVIGVEKGIYAKHGIDVTLHQPEDHYDGFDDLADGKIQLAVNEPIHMIEHFRDDIICLGAFFETNGGVMIKKEEHQNMLDGKPIRVTTPAANPTTDLVATQILKKYFDKQGVEPEKLHVTFEETDFYHLKHLKEGYEAAWLCFENFEGVEARFEGVENILIDSKKAGYPNFSALEMVANREFYEAHQEEYARFIDITNEIIEGIEAGKYDVKSIYYAYSKEEKSELMDAIIDDSATRFYAITPSGKRWQSLYDWFKELELTTINQDQYDNMFKGVVHA